MAMNQAFRNLSSYVNLSDYLVQYFNRNVCENHVTNLYKSTGIFLNEGDPFINYIRERLNNREVLPIRYSYLLKTILLV